MVPDPGRVRDARAWLVKAAEDLRGAAHGLEARPPLVGDVLFHCQQAAEKSLKAFLAWHDTPFRKTHSLEELGEQCARVDSTLAPIVDRAVPLTEYAWKFRYPGEPEEPPGQEAEEALRVARELWEAVLDRLPVEAHPAR
jgi:HEPN domain-containing protein